MFNDAGSHASRDDDRVGRPYNGSVSAGSFQIPQSSTSVASEDLRAQYTHLAWSKYLAELVGTYFIVVTVGCNILAGSVGASLSIGCMLMVMVYALGTVSGAHFNPAVTVAVWLSARGLLPLRHAICYMIAQLFGAMLGVATYTVILGGTFAYEPVGHHSPSAVLVVEAIYSTALCYVVLNVATSKDDNHYFGVSIGFTFVSACLSCSSISGCSLNPALALSGMLAASYYAGWDALHYLPLYFFAPFVGSVVGWAAFYVVRHPDEYASPSWKKSDSESDGLDSSLGY